MGTKVETLHMLQSSISSFVAMVAQNQVDEQQKLEMLLLPQFLSHSVQLHSIVPDICLHKSEYGFLDIPILSIFFRISKVPSKIRKISRNQIFFRNTLNWNKMTY